VSVFKIDKKEWKVIPNQKRPLKALLFGSPVLFLLYPRYNFRVVLNMILGIVSKVLSDKSLVTAKRLIVLLQ
jgi:hypothetical protein